MPTIHKRGWSKNVALTAWLLLPIAFVAVLVVGIFISYSKGPAMQARPVGQGAGDTGGANALGEWLAGNDPDEIQQARIDLREGRLVDPLDWPGGILLVLERGNSQEGPHAAWLWGGAGSDRLDKLLTCGAASNVHTPPGTSARISCSTLIPHTQLAAAFAGGNTGAGIFISPTEAVSEKGGLLVDSRGGPLGPVEITLVPRAETTEGEPIEIHVVIRSD